MRKTRIRVAFIAGFALIGCDSSGPGVAPPPASSPAPASTSKGDLKAGGANQLNPGQMKVSPE